MDRLLLGLCLLLVWPAHATTFEYSGSVASHYEHHSNVSVTEISESASVDDAALRLSFNIDGALDFEQGSRLDAGYSYSDQRYATYSEYDIATHLVYLDGSHEVGHYTLGLSHYYAQASLDRADFMTLNQSLFYAARLLGNQWYLRASVAMVSKDFTEFEGRSATSLGVGSDIFWFAKDSRRFVRLGLQLDDESADNIAFSYQGWTLQATVSQRSKVLTYDTRWQLFARWRQRDYVSDSALQSAALNGQARNDTHLVAEGRVDVSVIDWLVLGGSIERGRYRSNLATADYAETRLAVGVTAHF